MLSQSSFHPAPTRFPAPLRLCFPHESPGGTSILRCPLLFSFPFHPRILPSDSGIRLSGLFPVRRDRCMGLPAFLLLCMVWNQIQAYSYCCTEQHPRTSAPVPGSESVRPENPDRWVHLENPGNPESRDLPGNPAPPDPAGYPIPVLSFSAFPVLFHSAGFSALSVQAVTAAFPDPARSCWYRMSSACLRHLPHRPL